MEKLQCFLLCQRISLCAIYESSRKKYLASSVQLYFITSKYSVMFIGWASSKCCKSFVSVADYQTHFCQKHTCYSYGYYFIWQQDYPSYWKGAHFPIRHNEHLRKYWTWKETASWSLCQPTDQCKYSYKHFLPLLSMSGLLFYIYKATL